MNNGPSNISQTVLELRCPLSFQGQRLLYPLEFSTKGPLNCTSDRTLNPLHLQVSLNLRTCVLELCSSLGGSVLASSWTQMCH